MTQTVTTVAPASDKKIVRLSLPPGAKLHAKSPFHNNMPAELLGEDPKSNDHMLVKVEGSTLSWRKDCVHNS